MGVFVLMSVNGIDTKLKSNVAMDLLVVLTEWFCSKLLTFRTATQIVKSGQKFRTDFKMLTVLKVRTLD